jgi:hypothetical protein
MLNNQKTTDLVKPILENDLYLLELLKEDLVNYSALARKILPAIKKENPKSTEESVSIAVRRYVAGEKSKQLVKSVKSIISRSQLSTKNDVIHLTFRRDDAILAKILDVSKKIKWNEGETFFFNQGLGEVTIIIDQKYRKLFDDCRKFLIEDSKDLCIISIKENMEDNEKKSIDVPGVYSYFIGQLSRKSVNIIEIVSTYTQLSLILKSEDLLRAYSILEDSIRYFRKN